MLISDADLFKNQYDYETLKANIYVVSLLNILKTQKLSSEFCAKYILNKDFHLLQEEMTINIESVKKYQPHIEINNITNDLKNLTNNKLLGKRVDSIDNFENYMNKNM